MDKTVSKKIEIFIFNKLKFKNKRYLLLKKKTNLFNQGIDSIDFFSLIFDVENKYKIKIKEKMYLKLNTIEKLINFIKKNTYIS